MRNDPIRVLHVIGIMNRGGAETMIMNLYRQIDRAKIQFDFVESCSEKAAFDDEIRSLGGRTYHCPHYNGRNHFQYCRWWKHFFQKHKEYRIVHGHIGSTAPLYLEAAKAAGAYTIAHSHNSGKDYSIKGLLYRFLAYRVRYIADYFFACSEAAGLDRFGNCVVSGTNYKVFHNAIDVQSYQFRAEERMRIRSELNVQDKIVIGHVGRFERQKNHEFLIDIFRVIHDQNPESVLLLIGDGSLRRKIEKKVEQLKLTDAVLFGGVRQDVNCLLQAMDVFVFPSLYEGLPLVTVEAQAAGLPCVISDRVPEECILTDKLVKVCGLNESLKTWAAAAQGQARITRTDTSQEVQMHGYDISETASWLESFYLEKWHD